MVKNGKHVFAHFNLVFFFPQTSSTSFAFKHGGVGLYPVSNSKCIHGTKKKKKKKKKKKSLKLFRNTGI